MSGQRLIHFSGQTIAIDYANNECKQVVEFLYQQLEKPSQGSLQPHVTITLDGDNEQGFVLSQGDRAIYSGDSTGDLANALVGETIFHLTDNNADGMVLHAGCVSNRNQGILLPGVSGAGKSTLSAWLTNYGYHYHTDEMVFVPKQDSILHAFPRPINIKSHGLEVVKEFIDIEGQQTKALSGSHITMISQDMLRNDNRYATPELSLILAPHYQTGAKFKLTRLTSAQTGLLLMECLINARNLEGHGFPESTRLARLVPSYRLTYSNFDQLDESFFKILPDIAIEGPQ